MIPADFPPDARWVLRQARKRLVVLHRRDWPGQQPQNYLGLFWPPERLRTLANANAWPLPEPLRDWLFRDPVAVRRQKRRRLRRLARDLAEVLRDPDSRDFLRDLLFNLPTTSPYPPQETPHAQAPLVEEDVGDDASPGRRRPDPERSDEEDLAF